MKKYKVKCKRCKEVNTIYAENERMVMKCYGCPCGSMDFKILGDKHD